MKVLLSMLFLILNLAPSLGIGDDSDLKNDPADPNQILDDLERYHRPPPYYPTPPSHHFPRYCGKKDVCGWTPGWRCYPPPECCWEAQDPKCRGYGQE